MKRSRIAGIMEKVLVFGVGGGITIFATASLAYEHLWETADGNKDLTALCSQWSDSDREFASAVDDARKESGQETNARALVKAMDAVREIVCAE